MPSFILIKFQNPFKKKEKKLFPQEFAMIKLTDLAKAKGLTDDQNKIIVYYSNGESLWRIPYTPEDVQAIREVYRIPIEEEKFIDENFEFDTIGETGEVVTKWTYKSSNKQEFYLW